MLLAAAATAAGLAVLGTVAAQAPPAPFPAKAGAGAAPVRPAGQVPPGAYPAPQPAGVGARPAGYLQPQTPAGTGGATRPRLTNPVMAGPDGVRPAGGEVPPPSLEPPAVRPGIGAAPPVSLPPPSVSQDQADSKDAKAPPAALPVDPPVGVPSLPPAGPAVTPAEPRPLVPVPPAVGGTGGAPALPPAVPVLTPVTPGSDTVVSPPGAAAAPAGVPAAALPGKATHSVTLEAVCPESVVFGEEVRYELVVRNAGTAPVGGVRVEDEVPAGAKYVGSDPPAEAVGDRLAWAVGTLEAGAERRIAVRVRPADEGELRSRATVTCAAAVEARTRVTRPRLAVAVTAAEGCRAGDEVGFQIKVTNTGTGPAQNMVVQALLSDGLFHPQAPKPPQEARLQIDVPSLPPGEAKTLTLPVTAVKPGQQWCQVTASAPGNPAATGKAAVVVVEPQLKVAQAGPARCLVRGEPAYEITLSNPGTAPTDPVTVYTLLPEGFEFVSGSDGAAFSGANRAVVWKVPGLPAGGTKALALKVRAAAAGDGLLRTIAQAGGDPAPQGAVPASAGAPPRPAGRGLEAKADTAVKAEGVAAVRFEVAAVEGVVEVGKEAVYEIRVTNPGTGPCTNVQLVAALADGLAYTGSSGPTQVKAQGQNLFFEPIPTLPVKGEMVYRVKARGAAAGDLRVRVQLTCDQARTPVVKEESTRFVKE
jgi:uncharacterized repeat protein (TIGR01451 family)